MIHDLMIIGIVTVICFCLGALTWEAATGSVPAAVEIVLGFFICAAGLALIVWGLPVGAAAVGITQ